MDTQLIPTLTGVGELGACCEIHIFLGPVATEETVNATEFRNVVAQYKEAVKLWNATRREVLGKRDQDVIHGEMKAPVLTLVFRDGDGEQPLTVCQSARYVYCNSVDKMQALCHEDAEFFRAQGFNVIREKIEATAHGIRGVPQDAAEASKYPHLYFEFHIKVQKRGDNGEPQPIAHEEETQLRALANSLSRDLRVPIPLSYNREKNESNTDNGGCQRFLNVRFYELGLAEIKPKLEAIYAAIESSGSFRKVKTISEYVWHDTNKALDHGWIEYSPAELAALQERLCRE